MTDHSQTDLTFRGFEPGDAVAMLALHVAAVAGIADAYYTRDLRDAWIANRRADHYAEGAAAGTVYILAHEGDTLMGFIGYVPGPAGRIAYLYVAPAAQGQRIGQRLLAMAEEALFDGGSSTIAVTASLNARGFYAARGYVETGAEVAQTDAGIPLSNMGMEKHRTALRPDGTPWRNFYGRRHGKKLRPAQQRDMDGALREIQPQGVTRSDNPARTPIDLEELFGDDRPVWLEIGFGAGEHMFHQAKTYPEVGIIGCEPFINGVAQFMAKMRDAGVGNVRVHPGDARDLLEVLPEAALDKVFLLYPDPWPKTRHHRRRFVVPENLVAVARALKPGGIFRVATDIPDYVRQTLEVTGPMPEFEWLAEGPSDWREPWSDWTRTRYEAKAIREDRVPHYLTFRRV